MTYYCTVKFNALCVIQNFKYQEFFKYNVMKTHRCLCTCDYCILGMIECMLLLSKTANFPFRPMDYSPWSSKNLIDRNQLKKFMHISLDVTYIHTNFGECDLSGFGDIATFKNNKFSLSTHGL